MAYIDSDIPTAIWADATFHSFSTTYPQGANLTKGYYSDGESLDRRALERATLCVFSSYWAANSAIQDYAINPKKVKVIPFGANIDDRPSSTYTKSAINARTPSRIRLLFVGVEFFRKGGPKVLEVLSELLRLGVQADLRIVGCVPDIPEHLKANIEVLGFVSKSTLKGRQTIAECFLSSHWLILLPVAECYGIVFAEANAYGVPCIANRVGGIPTIIADNKNGRMFEATSSPTQIANYIVEVSRDCPRYIAMAMSAYEESVTRLNWETAGLRFMDVARAALSERAQNRLNYGFEDRESRA